MRLQTCVTMPGLRTIALCMPGRHSTNWSKPPVFCGISNDTVAYIVFWLDSTDCTLLTKLPEKKITSIPVLNREISTLDASEHPHTLAWTLYSFASQTLWVLLHLRSLCSLALATAPLPRASRLFQAQHFVDYSSLGFISNGSFSEMPPITFHDGQNNAIPKGLLPSPWKLWLWSYMEEEETFQEGVNILRRAD